MELGRKKLINDLHFLLYRCETNFKIHITKKRQITFIIYFEYYAFLL